jgi:hypothetical protein
MDWKFRDFNGRIVDLRRNTRDVVFVVANFLDCPIKATPPRQHGYKVLAFHHPPDIGDNINRVITWYRGTPT